MKLIAENTDDADDAEAEAEAFGFQTKVFLPLTHQRVKVERLCHRSLSSSASSAFSASSAVTSIAGFRINGHST